MGDVAEPQLADPQDAIVRVDAVTICGTDLHILKGDVPEVESGRILGHEAVGTVEQVGSAVRTVTPGDRVLISCISACGRCRYCRIGRYGQCLGGGGWILGHLIDGTQAQYVRVPFAETSAYVLPDPVADESALMLADIMPTAYEVGVLNGQVSPGDTVAIVGAGPIGLAAITTARLFSPSHIVAIDVAKARLDAAARFGADTTVASEDSPEGVVRELTDGLGADVVIEAVGVPETFELCCRRFARAVTSRTSASTERPPPCTSSRCGSKTSRSPQGSSTRTPRPRCSPWPVPDSSTPADSSRTGSASTK